jgi:hypothetical protein
MNLITFNEWCVKKGLLIESTPTDKMFTIEEKNGKTSTGWKPSRLKEFYFGEKGIEDWIDNCKQGDEFSDSYGGKIKCVFAPFSFSDKKASPLQNSGGNKTFKYVMSPEVEAILNKQKK